MNRNIEVFSTFAQDVFLNGDGQVLKIQPGGPATFIQQTFDTLGANYVLNFGETMRVEILVTKQGEFGRIKVATAKQLIKSQQSYSILLVSTLLDEWILPQTSSKIFLDVQGYVRDGNKFGGKKIFTVDSQLESNLTCLKATQEEIKYLPANFLERQKRKQLIITQGSAEIKLFLLGKRYDIPIIPIENLTDTVGAGDVWFASYVAYQAEGNECLTSAKRATEFVSQFLRKKERKYEIKN